MIMKPEFLITQKNSILKIKCFVSEKCCGDCSGVTGDGEMKCKKCNTGLLLDKIEDIKKYY